MQRFRIGYLFTCTLFVSLLIFSQPSLANAGAGVGVYQKTLEWQADVGLVSTIEWSPNGQWIAVVSEEGTLQITNADTGNVLHTLQVDRQLVSLRGLDWNIDNVRLVTSGGDRMVRIWDAIAGRQLCAFDGYGHSDPGKTLPERITAVKWSPDGTVLASAGLDGFTRFWDTPATSECASLRSTTLDTSNFWAVADIDWNTSGNQIISSGTTTDASIWDTSTGEIVEDIPCPLESSSPYYSCRFFHIDWSPDSRYIFASGEGIEAHFTQIWDVETDVSRDIVSSCGVGAQWMPLSIALFSWCESEIQIWDANNFEVIGGTQNATAGWEQDSGTCSACYAISPDEQRLVLAYYTDYAGATDAEANMVFEIWDIVD